MERRLNLLSRSSHHGNSNTNKLIDNNESNKDEHRWQYYVAVTLLGGASCCLLFITSILRRKIQYLQSQLKLAYDKEELILNDEDLEQKKEESCNEVSNGKESYLALQQSKELVGKIKNKDVNSSSDNKKYFTLTEIGEITSPFPLRAGTPRQGLLAIHSRSILTLHSFIPREAFDDLDQYSHVWVLFQFHLNPVNKGKAPKKKKKIQQQQQQQKEKNKNQQQYYTDKYMFKSSKIKPPRAKGRKVGVYATRSPHRLNNIGLSLALVEKVETVGYKSTKRTIIKLLGLDLVDGTPVYDIKPYIPSDCILAPAITNPITQMDSIIKTPFWVSDDNDKFSSVSWTEEAKNVVRQEQQSGSLSPLYPPYSGVERRINHTNNIIMDKEEVINAISEIVAQDPRAQYDGREQCGTFEITFCSLRIRFKVSPTMDSVPADIDQKQESPHLHALIEKVFKDPGDVTAPYGSYQRNLALRTQSESDAKDKGIKLMWKYPVREGDCDEKILSLKSGDFWDVDQKIIV